MSFKLPWPNPSMASCIVRSNGLGSLGVLKSFIDDNSLNSLSALRVLHPLHAVIKLVHVFSYIHHKLKMYQSTNRVSEKTRGNRLHHLQVASPTNQRTPPRHCGTMWSSVSPFVTLPRDGFFPQY